MTRETLKWTQTGADILKISGIGYGV